MASGGASGDSIRLGRVYPSCHGDQLERYVWGIPSRRLVYSCDRLHDRLGAGLHLYPDLMVVARPAGHCVAEVKNDDTTPYPVKECPRCGLSLRRQMPYCPNCGQLLGPKRATLSSVFSLIVLLAFGLPSAYVAGCNLFILVTEPHGEYTGLVGFFAVVGSIVFALSLIIFLAVRSAHKRAFRSHRREDL